MLEGTANPLKLLTNEHLKYRVASDTVTAMSLDNVYVLIGVGCSSLDSAHQVTTELLKACVALTVSNRIKPPLRLEHMHYRLIEDKKFSRCTLWFWPIKEEERKTMIEMVMSRNKYGFVSGVTSVNTYI